MVAYGELDPAPFIEQSKLLSETLCKQNRCPRLAYLPKHSHMSEVYAINSADASLTAPLFAFVKAGM